MNKKKDTTLLNKSIALRIKEMRMRRLISQESLARKMNLTHGCIGQIETGNINITLWTLYRILKALNFTFKDFFEEFSMEVLV